MNVQLNWTSIQWYIGALGGEKKRNFLKELTTVTGRAPRERGVFHCMGYCVGLSLMLCILNFALIFTRDSIGLYAITCICYRPSLCPSVTRVDQSKTVKVRIMQFSPHGSPIPLVFWDKIHPKFLTGSHERRRQTRVGWGKQAIF